jgi:hypothetical protein
MPNYLHNHPEFDDLLRAVGREKGIDAFLVAKDYWIMHVLYGLKKNGFKFQLKGGTSLSKGFELIERFSEDIDIHIEPPPEKHVETGVNRNEKGHCESRRNFYDGLASEIKIDGIEKVERDTAFDDEKYRSGGIRLYYPPAAQAIEGIKPGILLEVGFDRVTPNEPLKISSWALTFAQEKKLAVEDNAARGIRCYDPGYTFVEKLQAIAKKYGQQQSAKTLPTNFIRHYYDVMYLLKDKRIQDFIGTEPYRRHKEERFRGGLRGLDLSRCEAFLLSDQATRDLYRREYEKTKNLYYQKQPSFDEVLSCINKYLPSL